MRDQSVGRWGWSLVWLALALPAQAMDDQTASQLATMQQQLDALTQRVGTLESQSSSILSLQSEIDALKSENARMHGQLDEQAHDISVADKRQTDLYQDLDGRLRALSQSNASASVPALASGAASAAATSAASPDAAPETAPRETTQAQAYQAALTQFKQGDYSGAIASFKKFVQANPNDALAASAQYWIGNAYFSIKDFKNAQLAQQKLIAAYPKSPKVPDAMLNLSSAQIELGDIEGARKTLKKLISKFPGSSAAELGKKRLQLMQGA